MSRRVLAALAAALVIAAALVAVPRSALAQGTPATAATRASVAATPPTDPSGGDVDNPFIPEDRDLSECISAVPRPGCGSEARGGWRQALLFGIVLVALAFFSWQITRIVRRNRRALDAAADHEPRPDRTEPDGPDEGPSAGRRGGTDGPTGARTRR